MSPLHCGDEMEILVQELEKIYLNKYNLKSYLLL